MLASVADELPPIFLLCTGMLGEAGCVSPVQILGKRTKSEMVVPRQYQLGVLVIVQS